MKVAFLALILLILPQPLRSACRQALAIGLDVSASVDTAEFRLQMEGLAQALRSDRVRAALLTAPETPVLLAAYDWSGADDQRLILTWTAITDDAALERAAFAIGTAVRVIRAPATGVGAALLYGDALLAEQPDCARHVLDLTGDGLNNSGVQPRDVVLPDRNVPVTVNALVIGVNNDAGWDGGDPGIAELSAWFSREVIRGPGAFVETALGFEDFTAAMERKLLRELGTVEVSALGSPPDEAQ